MKSRLHSGFTLVELMVVVVILVLLAGLVFMSYSQWRQDTAETAVKSDLINATAAMKNAANWSGQYPSTIPSSFSPSDNATVTVQNATATYFCLKGVSTSVTSVVFYVSSSNGTPHTGSC